MKPLLRMLHEDNASTIARLSSLASEGFRIKVYNKKRVGPRQDEYEFVVDLALDKLPAGAELLTPLLTGLWNPVVDVLKSIPRHSALRDGAIEEVVEACRAILPLVQAAHARMPERPA